MSGKADKRPLSPFMLGPYYRFQITSLLSISNRITGMLLTVIAAPLAIAWLVALGMGEEAFESFRACLGGIIGKALLLASLFSLWFHFLGGLRHLAWDMGMGFEMSQVRATGWAVVIGSIVLTTATWMVAS